MKRKILKYLGWTLAVACGLFLIALLTVDFWAPWVIRPVLEGQGVSYDEITREDGHYTLTEVEYAGDGLEASVEKLLIPTPSLLMLKRYFGSDKKAMVWSSNAYIKQTPGTEEPSQKSDGEPINLPQLIEQAFGYWDQGFGWVNEVSLNDISFETAEGKVYHDFSLSLFPEVFGIHYDHDGTLTLGNAIDLRIDRSSDEEFSLSLQAPSYDISLQSYWEVTDILQVEGNLFLPDAASASQFSARWGADGIVPEAARFFKKDYQIPTSLYEVPDYEQPRITLKADWDGAKADIDLDATAAPKAGDLPPLKVALKARGDDQIINVEQFDAAAWSSKVALSKPLRVDINNLKDLPDAELTVDLNLSDIPDQRLDGRLQGALVVDHQPGEGWPLFTADFAGNDLRYEEFNLSQLDVRAQLDYPTVTIEALDVSIGEGSSVSVKGVANIEEKNIAESEVRLKADASLLEALQPIIGEQDVAFQQLSVRATASGALETPKHEGEIRVEGLQLKEGLAMNVETSWTADWLEFSKLALSAKNERSGIKLAGKASLGGDYREVTIETASVDVREQPELTLEAPFTAGYGDEVISLSRMRLHSEAGGELLVEGKVEYPKAGQVKMVARDVSAVWLDLVLTEPLEYTVKLDELNVTAAWDNGPLEGELKLDAGLLPDDQPEVELIADLTLKEGKLSLPTLSIVQGDFSLLNAKGDVPMVVTPAGEQLLTLADKAPIDFHLQAEPDDSPLWNQLEDMLALDFVQPVLNVQITGDMSAPDGKVDLVFRELKALMESEDARPLPPLENADFKVSLNAGEIALTKGQVLVSGQALNVKGTAPMNGESWAALFKGEPPDWQEASANLDFTDVPLTAFKEWLPDVLRDDGDLSLRASLKPGGKVEGSLDIDDVKTRPLAQLGAVSDINAAFRLEDRTLRVEQAEARIGGSPLGVTGRVDLDDQWRPIFDLAMRGENIPLARSPGIILRGSPNITLKTDGEGVTTIGGVLTMNESFFTMDLGVFTDDGGGGGAARGGQASAPPFFSIEDEPLASWRLKLKVEGDRFLRVRVPTFVGVVSAGFNLRGSLKSPLMYGSAEPQQGVVMFPFATLQMDEGGVTISQNEPDVVRLNMTATGRAYGYDLVMRITGTANQPTVSFSSTPSLEQSDILLMVTSGQIPQHARSTESRLSGIGMYIGKSFLVDLGLIDPLDDTLQVSIGEDVTTSGKDTINILYKIDEDWALEGAYDKYDAYNLDAKYRIIGDRN